MAVARGQADAEANGMRARLEELQAFVDRRVAEGGVSVPGEIYRVPDDVWRRVEAGEPPGLYRGPVSLDDGRVVPGILFPRDLAERHPDISDYGGWRAYWAARPATNVGER
jgi:hypothetical protein